MKGGNLAIAPFTPPADGDGEEPGENITTQIILDTAKNGWVVTIHSGEDDYSEVFLHSGSKDNGPKQMIQRIIDELGITDKVRLEK